jgi:hypothetical protein
LIYAPISTTQWEAFVSCPGADTDEAFNDVSIYSMDGYLWENRTVNFADKSLTFTNNINSLDLIFKGLPTSTTSALSSDLSLFADSNGKLYLKQPVNIYNSDGTLTANRTVTLNSRSLSIFAGRSTTFFEDGDSGIRQSSNNNSFVRFRTENAHSGPGAAAGILMVNDLPFHGSQLYMGSSGNIYAPDALLIRNGGGSGGVIIGADFGNIDLRVNGYLVADTKFRLSNAGDVTLFNLAGVGDRPVYADTTGKLKIGSGGGTDTNIYNTDGTITDNRTINGNNFYLLISDVSYFSVFTPDTATLDLGRASISMGATGGLAVSYYYNLSDGRYTNGYLALPTENKLEMEYVELLSGQANRQLMRVSQTLTEGVAIKTTDRRLFDSVDAREHKIAVKSDSITINSYTNTTYVSDTTTKLLIKSLPTYANEAAAVTAGLDTDQIYKTSTGELRIKL